MAAFANIITIVSDDAESWPRRRCRSGRIPLPLRYPCGPEARQGDVVRGRPPHQRQGGMDLGRSTESVPPEEFEEHVRELAHSITRTPASLLHPNKETVNRAVDSPTDALLHLTPKTGRSCRTA